MSSALPGLVSFPRPSRRVTVSNYPHEPAEEVVIQSDQVDSGNSAFRTTFLRPGCVLVKRTSSGEYVLASDANADEQAAAAVATLVTNPGSGGWDGTLTIKGHWGSLSVSLSADNTDAAVATAINSAAAALNPESRAPIVAADTTGEVTITNADKGAGTWLHCVHGTVTTMFGSTGAGSIGTDPEVRVTLGYVDMLNGAGTAVAASSGPVLRAGNFDAANLIQPTAEAVACLLKQGSRLTGTLTLVGQS